METIVLINIFATVALLFYAVMQHEELDRHEKAIKKLARKFEIGHWHFVEKEVDDILNGKH